MFTPLKQGHWEHVAEGGRPGIRRHVPQWDHPDEPDPRGTPWATPWSPRSAPGSSAPTPRVRGRTNHNPEVLLPCACRTDTHSSGGAESPGSGESRRRGRGTSSPARQARETDRPVLRLDERRRRDRGLWRDLPQRDAHRRRHGREPELPPAGVDLHRRRGAASGVGPARLLDLVAGLSTAGLAAGVLTVVLDLLGLLPPGFAVGRGGRQGLTTVKSSTFVVALAAGSAGILQRADPRDRAPWHSGQPAATWGCPPSVTWRHAPLPPAQRERDARTDPGGRERDARTEPGGRRTP
ncbi:MAG: hypothetical protein QOG77_247 [Solirubrobacteraceae bacterium]|nr:hypothetical protein [Solirubrobacteraceae bacterium]